VAIQFVGAASAGKLGAASGNTTIALNSGLTGGIASSVSADDLVIAVFGSGSQEDRTLAITDGTNPYTIISSELWINASVSVDTNMRVAYKFMGSTPDTSTTFGPTQNSADGGAMAVYVFRGVDKTTPLDGVTPTTDSKNNSALVNPPTITPSTAGAFIVVAGAAGHTGGVDTFSSSDLTSFRSQGSSNDNYDASIGIGHKPDWTSGAFDPAQWTFTQADSTSFSCLALSFVLRSNERALTATGIATGAPTVGTPALTQAHSLTATGIATGAPTVGTPALTQEHDLTATGIATGAPTVGNPALTENSASDDLEADGISTGAPTVGEPALTQEHDLTADGISTGAPTVGTPALTQEHGLTATGIATGAPTTGTPALTQVHDLAADGVSTGAPTVGTPALSENDSVDDLLADGISTGAPTAGTPVLTQVHALAADGIATGEPTVGSPPLGGDAPVIETPSAGWSNWLNNIPRPRQAEDEPKPKRKKRRKRKPDYEPFVPAPDPLIERGIVQITPAWDVMVQLQQMQQEAEIARLERLRAIALADDEWMMMV
jgi:hypothetical protein